MGETPVKLELMNIEGLDIWELPPAKDGHESTEASEAREER